MAIADETIHFTDFGKDFLPTEKGEEDIWIGHQKSQFNQGLAVFLVGAPSAGENSFSLD